ncbi:protein-disulfide reductase DsbD family protein [Lacibacter sediminis]|uniref:Thioredoxin family protein n=1 Tax=Lacibacter sediminis TaxID=2760713 RepID=A0A7G5XKH3_9BACT|nr:cytochrome c biogenesis protein CcdA [Lacibacter sediminis]QNA45976.1 thioredoxin family protein [Lacibacter sediminis]
MKRRTIAMLYLLLGFLATAQYVRAEDSTAVAIGYSKQRISDKEVLLSLHINIKPGVKFFALQKKEEDVLFSTVTFDSSANNYLSGTVTEKGTKKTELDASTQAQVEYFSDSVVWEQKINANEADSFLVKGTINYLFAKGDEYIPGEQAFKFFIKPEQTISNNSTDGNSAVANRSLLWIFLAAFGGGLLALLTPCVYSMIPVTVSFFTKRSKTKAEGIRNALYYAGSIVVIFTLLGFLVTLIFGPAALNNLATNWIANLVFFALFLVFGFSFLGAFEITLPSSWTNKSDAKASTGSFLGIFFMALTLVLVSFSCTGPIIGNLLVLASKGSYFGPLVGMLGFSTALALPFALFAFFPSKLNVLGKAGGWLNAVKVTLGFLELALALKFLSNADLVKGWRILDREVFITLWIVIFVLLGVYLLGKLKFHHDDELPKNDFGLPYLTVTRLMFAITAFAFAVYMIPGLFGAPLKSISAFVPPMGTQDFVMGAGMHTSASSSNSAANEQPHPSKYYEQMKMYEPEVVTKYGMITYFDYDEALAVARKLKKPLMLDFTGINCVNCRKMEGQVWSDAEVMKKLKEDFVIVSLYVDVQNVDLQESEQYFSKALNKQVETLGDKNADLQVTQYGANSQPYYFFLDANEKRIVPDGYGYDPDIEKFKQLLDTVKAKHKATL